MIIAVEVLLVVRAERGTGNGSCVCNAHFLPCPLCCQTILLFIIIGGPVVSAFIYIIQWGGKQFYFYLWLFVLVFR